MEGLLKTNQFRVSRPAHHISALEECTIRPAKFHGPLVHIRSRQPPRLPRRPRATRADRLRAALAARRRRLWPPSPHVSGLLAGGKGAGVQSLEDLFHR